MIGLILPQFRNLFWIKAETSYIFGKGLLTQSELRKRGGRSNLIRIFNEINRAALFYNMGNIVGTSVSVIDLGKLSSYFNFFIPVIDGLEWLNVKVKALCSIHWSKTEAIHQDLAKNQPYVGPNNFKVKPKLNTKEKITFGKEALELADWMLLG